MVSFKPYLGAGLVEDGSEEMLHTELVLLFEVGARPPHDGVRRMEWSNLCYALAAEAAGFAAITNSPHPSSP
jgi:hypothetical protein